MYQPEKLLRQRYVREPGMNSLTANLVVADKSRMEKTICLAVFSSLKASDISRLAWLFEVVQRVELGKSDRVELGRIFNFLNPQEEAHPQIQVTYFLPDQRKDGGAYVTITGRLKLRPLEPHERDMAEENHGLVLQFLAANRLPMEDYYDVVIFRYLLLHVIFIISPSHRMVKKGFFSAPQISPAPVLRKETSHSTAGFRPKGGLPKPFSPVWEQMISKKYFKVP